MPYDLSGNFTRLHNWEEDRKNDVEIMSDRHDEEDDNFTQALNECFLRDGRTPMEGNLNLGNYQIKNVAQAVVDNDAVNLAQANSITDKAVQNCKNVMSSFFYIGDVKASLQNQNHGDWLLCNGQEVNRADYADLFDLIGTSFGVGDGINTFNLPDYRGKFLRGLGGDSADDVYTTQAEGLPNITGQTQGQDGYLRAPNASGAFETVQVAGDSRSGDNNQSAAYSTFDASRSNAIYGASEHVTPINMAVNYFIKAKGLEI